jgi:hypothetical protein
LIGKRSGRNEEEIIKEARSFFRARERRGRRSDHEIGTLNT